MIKILGVVFAIAGAISLVLGVLGLFESLSTGVNPWALTILGIVFMAAGTGLLKKV